MVTDPVCRRTQRLTFAIVISIDDDDWFFCPHIDDKLPGFALLFRRQTQFGLRIRPHRAVDVKPRVQHAHFDQAVDPLFRQQMINVTFGETCANACHNIVF